MLVEVVLNLKKRKPIVVLMDRPRDVFRPVPHPLKAIWLNKS